MKKRTVLALSVVLFGSHVAVAADQYLCVVDQATGFAYEEPSSEWMTTRFRGDIKYVVSRANGEDYAFVVRQLGDDHISAFCKKGFNEGHYLFCSGLGNEFKLNRRNGRFLM